MWIDPGGIDLGRQLFSHASISDVLEPHGLSMHMIRRQISMLPKPGFPEPMGADQLARSAIPLLGQDTAIVLQIDQSVASNTPYGDPGDYDSDLGEGHDRAAYVDSGHATVVLDRSENETKRILAGDPDPQTPTMENLGEQSMPWSQQPGKEEQHAGHHGHHSGRGGFGDITEPAGDIDGRQMTK